MPHLRFDVNFEVPPEEKRRFAAAVVAHFSQIMDTGTDHIAVAIACHAPDDLTFGRARPGGGRAVLLDADIRLGRTRDQKRRLALALIGEAERIWEVDPRAVYVVYTEHDGESFQLSDRVLPSWSAGEDPLAGPPAPRPRGKGGSAPRAGRARRPAPRRPSR